MTKILLIESATSVCSVSLAREDKVIAKRESFIDRTHAKLLAPFIQEVMEETKLRIPDLDAIAVSIGPGSYTGLRIGVSMAKGLSYASGVPIIAVPTLEAMAWGLNRKSELEENASFLCPMIDARRMEVYTAVYNSRVENIKEAAPLIVEKDSFDELLNKGNCYLFGSGAEKLKDELNHNNLIFRDDFIHSSTNMAIPAFKLFEANKFEDVAYFEPFYLKEFITTTPKKKIF